jgi:hypothetical protein
MLRRGFGASAVKNEEEIRVRLLMQQQLSKGLQGADEDWDFASCFIVSDDEADGGAVACSEEVDVAGCSGFLPSCASLAFCSSSSFLIFSIHIFFNSCFFFSRSSTAFCQSAEQPQRKKQAGKTTLWNETRGKDRRADKDEPSSLNGRKERKEWSGGFRVRTWERLEKRSDVKDRVDLEEGR